MTRRKQEGKAAADLSAVSSPALQAAEPEEDSGSDETQTREDITSPVDPAHLFDETHHSPEQIRDLFRNGTFPYQTKIKTGVYEQHTEGLQVELLKIPELGKTIRTANYRLI